MAREGAFEITGVVVETLPNGTCVAELSNGHRLTAFQLRRESVKLALGQKVKLELSPYDLSQGRVLAVETAG